MAVRGRFRPDWPRWSRSAHGWERPLADPVRACILVVDSIWSGKDRLWPRLCENWDSVLICDQRARRSPSSRQRGYRQRSSDDRLIESFDLVTTPQRAQACRYTQKMGPQARIAAISGLIPNIAMARFRLYASTCKLISVRTCGSVLVRKWVCPIQTFSVPKGCSTVARRSRITSGCCSRRASAASTVASCSQRLTRR